MTIFIDKDRGKPTFTVSFLDGDKRVQWGLDPERGEDHLIDTFQDIINTVRPPIQPTVPAIPLGYDPLRDLTRVLQNSPDTGANAGAEAADRAACEEEQRLMNMGSALAKGINMGPEDIPVVDGDRNDLPDVNWGV